MAEPVPIRPDLPISVESAAMLFCADAIAEFITEKGDDPSGAVVILFDSDNNPSISFTNVCARDLCWSGECMIQRAMKGVIE